MSKIWFREYKWWNGGWPGWLIPCSIEGWFWILLMILGATYFGSNFQNGNGYIIGFILTILIGITVPLFKSKYK